jgi:TRAP-type C4-dicarboxylate transport system substrate-binding protein
MVIRIWRHLLSPALYATLLSLAFWHTTPRACAAERKVRVNLGTLAPRGSLYHQALQAMGESWRKSSDGKINLVIYPDDTQGGETDMVRLMRVGTLHAGLFTAVGLANIEPAVAGLQALPMVFRSLPGCFCWP